MLDILLNADGDIDVSGTGDIATTDSVRQAVKIRLKWIYGEWRLGPEFGFPWFEEVFVKSPNIDKIKALIREEIMKVSEVDSATVTFVYYDPAKRTAVFRYTITIGDETYREELTLYEQLRTDA